MKIGWCTPVNQGSGITRFSRYVAAELLRRGHEVTLLASDADVPSAPAAPNPIRIEPIEAARAPEYDTAFDAVFYNIGDHFGFHARILDIVDRVPGIGIFHDASILNFFLGWADRAGLGQAARERLVLDHCGPAALRRYQARDEEKDWLRICADVPMVEWLVCKTGAAIVHAEHYAERVASACAGPTARINLAYQPAIPLAPPPMPEGESGPLVITTIGRVNTNKCYGEIIEAIGASALLGPRTIFRIFGDGERTTRESLEALAAARGVRVEFPQPRDDAALSRCLESTDIVCALRRPILEGASASAIEGLMSGRPVVVADAGFYAELPNEFVVKVPAAVPVPALKDALERLASDGHGRHTRGLAARTWAMEAFSAVGYCEALERVMADFIEAKPLLRLGSKIGRNLARLGFAQDDPAVAAIADTAHGLFVGRKA